MQIAWRNWSKNYFLNILYYTGRLSRLWSPMSRLSIFFLSLSISPADFVTRSCGYKSSLVNREQNTKRPRRCRFARYLSSSTFWENVAALGYRQRAAEYQNGFAYHCSLLHPFRVPFCKSNRPLFISSLLLAAFHQLSSFPTRGQWNCTGWPLTPLSVREFPGDTGIRNETSPNVKFQSAPVEL